MYNALSFLVKRFRNEFNVSYSSVVMADLFPEQFKDKSIKDSSYDAAANRLYKASPEALVEKLTNKEVTYKNLSSYESKDFKTLVALLNKRIHNRHSSIACAIQKASEVASYDIDDAYVSGSSAKPATFLRIAFVFDKDFQTEFASALKSDGFEGNCSVLWGGLSLITSELTTFNDIVPSIDDLDKCQFDLFCSLILAALCGPRNYAEALGYTTGATAMTKVSKSKYASANKMRLVPLEFKGDHYWEYVTAVSSANSRYTAELTQEVRIGRSSSWCQAQGVLGIEEPSRLVSNKHCTITFEQGTFYLCDHGSTNGSLIIKAGTNQRVFVKGTTAILEHGDIVCLTPICNNRSLQEPSYTWSCGPSCANYRFEVI